MVTAACILAGLAGLVAFIRAESMPDDPIDWQPKDAWKFNSKE